MRVGIAILVLCTSGCLVVDERQSGYEAGRKAVRSVRDMNGPMGEAFLRMAEILPSPPDPKRSPEWNGGYRAGLRDELDHPTPIPAPGSGFFQTKGP